MSFASLGLSEALARAVEAAGYAHPTPVQQRAIPAVLQGRDLMVAAQTGTGKTGGFALPVLERLFPGGHPDREHRPGARQARVLVLTPTRELAAQVHDSFKLYARDLSLVSACIFGGVGANPQVQALARGVDVLVACPGRLLDLLSQGSVDLSRVEILVLDEADRMLDMGFIHDVKKVLAHLPAQRQNLLFSATFSQDISDLASRLLHNPERIEVTPPNTTVERIEQRIYRLPAIHKRALLAHLITQGAWEQVLVFTRTKHGANRLAEFLEKHGLPAAAIHGNKSQNARTKALADFKANNIRVLVATDIAARGLDIDQLPHVVNFELPNVEEDYVHRIGRTGRAGRSGEAISLVSPDEEKLLRNIERMTQQKIPDGDWMNFDLGTVVVERSEPRPPRPERPANNRGAAGRKDKGRERKPRADKPAAAESTAQTPRPARAARPAQQAQPRRHNAEPVTRDPEEFLDDDQDNFGNRVDYVSPYQGKNNARGRRPQAAAAQPRAARPAKATTSPRPASTGAGKTEAGQRPAARRERAPRPQGYAPARTPYRDDLRSEPAASRPAKQQHQPLILRKESKLDRFPSPELLEDLPSSTRPRGEKPALLTRNRPVATPAE